MNDRVLKYLNYVINDLISNTEIKKISPSRDPYMSLPWNNALLLSNDKVKRVLQYTNTPLIIMSYLNDSYGMESEEQMRYVWDTYKDFLTDVIYNKKTINESDDKMDMYIHKVLNILEDDTYLVNSSAVMIPFFTHPINFRKSDGYNFILYLLDVPSPPERFVSYCSDMYNIEGEYIKMLWDEYKLFLDDFIINNTRH